MTSVFRGAAAAFATALGVTLILAAPVLEKPSDRIFGAGEVLGMEDPNRDPLVVIEQFRSGHVARPYLQPLTDLPGRWLARLTGPVAAYNLLVLSSFPFAAAAAYVLGRRVVGSHLGAMVAALAFAFLPFHLSQAEGHPHVAQTQWIPLFFLALWRCADGPGIGRAAWLLAAAAAVAASNFYGGFIAATLSPIALLAYGVTAPRAEAGRWRRVAVTAGVLAVAAAVAMALIALLAPGVGTLAFPREDLFVWSARWWSYLVPPADHPLWGAAVRRFWAARGVGANALEHQQVGVPLALVALAAAAVVAWRRRDPAATPMVPAALIVAAAAVICSLSPERQVGTFVFVRPSALLHELAPMFRAYARFGVVAGLMAALLAGAGAAALWHRARGLVVLLLALAVVEVAPFPPWRWRSITAPQYLGFHPREEAAGRSWRWMGQTGALRITLPDAEADVVLVAELKAFPAGRRVDWLVDARRMGSIDVGPDWQRYTLGLGPLDRGAHTVTLACADPAVVAGALLANGDSRPLALAVGRWAIDPD